MLQQASRFHTKLGEELRRTMGKLETLLKHSGFEPSSGNAEKSSLDEQTYVPDNYFVRKAVSSDNWKIYQLMSSFFPEDGDHQEESKLEFSESDLHDALFKPEPVTQALVAIFKINGQESLVGYCLYNMVKMDFPFLLIEDVFVHPAFRGARVSSQMLHLIQDKIVKYLENAEDSCKILRWSGNQYAGCKVNFYEKYGARLLADFRRVQREEDELQEKQVSSYKVVPGKRQVPPPRRTRTIASVRPSTERATPLTRDRCRSITPN